MAYIGNIPAESFASFEKQVFTIVNSQTAYTLSHSVVNENDIRLVVNNVVQEPGSGKAYTASGTTLTLSAALVNGTDEMYCVFLGRALQTVNPPNASVGTAQLASTSVTAAKLNNDIISGSTELASEPADTDEFLVSDAGTLKRIDYSLIKGGGITIADSWRITASFNFTTQQTIDVNWERVDTAGMATIGSAMTQSSGIFTFPTTGIYLVIANIGFSSTTSTRYIESQIQYSSDSGSSFNYISRAHESINNVTGSTFANCTVFSYVDVPNTSTTRLRFRVEADGTSTMLGSTSYNENQSFLFIRLGDT